MSAPVRDLEHRFVVDGRSYHVHVVSDDPRPQPHLVCDDFDVAIFAGPNGNFDGEEPRTVALDVVENILKLMPTRPSPGRLGK